MAVKEDQLPIAGRPDGEQLMLESAMPPNLTFRADATFLRLDHAIAEVYVLATNIHQDGSPPIHNVERHVAFYEKVEGIVVCLLKFVGIEVDAQRTSSTKHRYHESVLETLADKNNIFHHILGKGEVYLGLRHAKTLRNKYRSSDFRIVNILTYYEEGFVIDRTRRIARALQQTCELVKTTIRNEYVPSAPREPLNDVAVVLERVSKHGQAQEQSLGPLVPSRLDEGRTKANGDLGVHVGNSYVQTVDLLRTKTDRIIELETIIRDLRSRSRLADARLTTKNKEAEEESEGWTKLRHENEDLKAKLKHMASNYDNALNHSKRHLDEKVAHRCQLEVEREAHQACQTRIVTLEEQNKRLIEVNSRSTYTRLVEERASHQDTKSYAADLLASHGLLSSQVSTLQDETKTLRAELATECSLRNHAERREGWLEYEVDTFRAVMERLLHRPLRPSRT